MLVYNLIPWKKQGCTFKLTQRANMPELQVLTAFKQCPLSPNELPYISIVFAGAAADEIAMPCDSSQDTCSGSKGMVCADLSTTLPFGVDLFGIGPNPTLQKPESLNDTFFSAMKLLGLYDNLDRGGGCYSMSSLVAGGPSIHPLRLF